VGSRLDHPNLRKCLKVVKQGGLMAGGPTQLMLVMELVDGTTLEARRPRSRRLMIGVFRAVAAGLSAMHEAGLVHADMKPINILLTNSGGVKVIDYGQSCPINTVKTRIQGTLDYIAPEQVHRGAITPRTDVYNLGATMYWCVTDRHPPTALRLRGTPGQPMPVVDNVLHDPREYNPHLPPALASLILDCLQFDPADRPASMKDLDFRLEMALLQLENQKRAAAASAARKDSADEPIIEAELLPEPVVLAAAPVSGGDPAQQELDLPAPMP
jgi:serine/threonine-protein kinase